MLTPKIAVLLIPAPRLFAMVFAAKQVFRISRPIREQTSCANAVNFCSDSQVAGQVAGPRGRGMFLWPRLAPYDFRGVQGATEISGLALSAQCETLISHRRCRSGIVRNAITPRQCLSCAILPCAESRRRRLIWHTGAGRRICDLPFEKARSSTKSAQSELRSRDLPGCCPTHGD